MISQEINITVRCWYGIYFCLPVILLQNWPCVNKLLKLKQNAHSSFRVPGYDHTSAKYTSKYSLCTRIFSLKLTPKRKESSQKTILLQYATPHVMGEVQILQLLSSKASIKPHKGQTFCAEVSERASSEFVIIPTTSIKKKANNLLPKANNLLI